MTLRHLSMHEERRAIGIWAQWPAEARWTNEGMTRLLGFLIEGAARSGRYVFRVVVPDAIRDTAEQDLRTLDAEIGRDFTLHSPRDHNLPCASLSDLAAFANQHVSIEAWLTLFPYFSAASLLEAPVTVIFPDAIPIAFPEFRSDLWEPEGHHIRWERDVVDLLSHAQGVVTFSEHVAQGHVGRLFKFAGDRITVIPHPPLDLAPLLPFVKGRRQSNASRRAAAKLLRQECVERNWPYLHRFPFEDVPYLAVSTQDRVTKNIQLVVRALLVILRERRRDMKLFMTAPLHMKQNWTALPAVLEDTLCPLDVVSMPDLPRPEHAALLHCATLAVHPSIFEGGHAPFPFFEAVSIGTPCIMAAGPHTDELARHEPDILDYCFDANDAEGLADLIGNIIEEREEVIARQHKIYSRLQRRDWTIVAEEYAETALRAVASKRGIFNDR